MPLLKKVLANIIVLLLAILTTTVIISLIIPSSIEIKDVKKEEITNLDNEQLNTKINNIIISNKELISYYIKDINIKDKGLYKKEIKRLLTSNENLIEYFFNIKLNDEIITQLTSSLTTMYYKEELASTNKTTSTNKYLDYLNIGTKIYKNITNTKARIILSMSIIILITILFNLKKNISDTIDSIRSSFIITAVLLSIFISGTESLYQLIPTSLITSIIYDTNYFLITVAIIILVVTMSTITYNIFEKNKSKKGFLY